jgi:hypothetical protein
MAGYSEDCSAVINGEECHVFVIDDELRTLESIVRTQILFQVVRSSVAEPMSVDDIEDLSRSVIVTRIRSLSQLLRSSIEFPMNSLQRAEEQTNKLEKTSCNEPLKH